MNHQDFLYRPKVYFVAVLAATTLFWLIGAAMSFSESFADFFMLPMLFGLMMPAIIATRKIWKTQNSLMKRDFINRIVNLKLIKPVTFVAAILLMPLSVVLAITLSLAFGGSTEQFIPSGAFSFNSGFVPVMLLLFLAALFEELGWRGYGFESLERGRSFFSACMIFGLLWSLWHLPLLVVKDSYQYEIFIENPWFAVNFFVGIVFMGIIVSWVCHINNRSILATILFHFAINLSQEMLSMTQQTKCLQTLVLAIFALIIVLSQRSLFFGSKKPLVKNALSYQ